LRINKTGVSGVFFDEIDEAARQHSAEASKAIKLDREYSRFGSYTGATAFIESNGSQTVKHNKDIIPFDDPFLMEVKIDIPVSMKEALTIDRSIEVIKARIKKHFRENFPATIGIPERMRKADGTLANGKFLPFAKWERCLHSYDQMATGKSIPDISREIRKLWPGHYDDKSNAFNKIKREIKEAERLIKSAANGTFPY
jgi:hypothetical protein